MNLLITTDADDPNALRQECGSQFVPRHGEKVLLSGAWHIVQEVRHEVDWGRLLRATVIVAR